MNNNKSDPDFFVEGFKRIDQSLVLRNPPKIKWGKEYLDWPDDRKIRYLEKLSAAMNEAAHLVQVERDELNRLIILKEEQLTQLSKAMAANNNMLQQEVTKMNAERQSFNTAVAKLNQEIRDLKKAE